MSENELATSDLDNISSFQEILLEVNETNINEIEEYLIENNFFREKHIIKQFLFAIDAASHAQPNRIPLFCEILKFSSEHIRSFFKPAEISTIFHNNQIYLTLYENNLIDIDCIVSLSRCGFATFLFFSKLLEEKAPSFYYNRLQKSSIIRRCLKNPQKNICEKEEPLTIAIQKDDISEFQSLISLSNISINSITPFSINQTNEFSNYGYETNPTLIEYSAFCGSLNIFKFLWMNEATFTKNILKMAVLGGSYDIIHILETTKLKFDESTLNTAIEFHRNEIVDYISSTMGIEFNNSSFLASISNYNISIFLNHIDNINQYDINQGLELACQKGTLDIATFLSSFIKVRNLIALSKAAANGHLDIVQYLVDVLNCDINVKEKNGWTPLFYAVRNFHSDVLTFLLSKNDIDLNAVDETGIFNIYF